MAVLACLLARDQFSEARCDIG